MSIKTFLLAAGALLCISGAPFAAQIAPSSSVAIVPVTAPMPPSAIAMAPALNIAMNVLPTADANSLDKMKLDSSYDAIGQTAQLGESVDPAPHFIAANYDHAIGNDPGLRLMIALDGNNAIQAPAHGSGIGIATAQLPIWNKFGSSSGGGTTALHLASALGDDPGPAGGKLPLGGLHIDTTI